MVTNGLCGFIEYNLRMWPRELIHGNPNFAVRFQLRKVVPRGLNRALIDLEEQSSLCADSDQSGN